jgi:hypothetical protein
MDQSSLEAVMRQIGERYVYTADQYPLLEGLAPAKRKAFAVNHSVHHMNKSIGKLSSACEAFDHGSPLNEESLREATVKMFIDTLKLAEEIGMTAKDLIEEVPRQIHND